jgi:hypothetical protein
MSQSTPAGSAGYVENHEAHVSEWAEGKIVKVTAYLPIDEGRAAAKRLAESRR